MFSYDDLLAKLQSGTSVDELASSFTEALNAANAEYQEKQKEQEEASKREAELRDRQVSLVRGVMGLLDGYVDDVYPELAEKWHSIYNDVSDNECLDMMFTIDTMIQMLMMFS